MHSSLLFFCDILNTVRTNVHLMNVYRCTFPYRFLSQSLSLIILFPLVQYNTVYRVLYLYIGFFIMEEFS